MAGTCRELELFADIFLVARGHVAAGGHQLTFLLFDACSPSHRLLRAAALTRNLRASMERHTVAPGQREQQVFDSACPVGASRRFSKTCVGHLYFKRSVLLIPIHPRRHGVSLLPFFV